jgi:competence protein ComEA
MRFIQSLVLATTLIFSALAFAAPVNINTASAKELAAGATGIGPVKAQRVVKYRKANGPFESLQGLKKVKGIGSKTIQANQDNLTVGEVAANDSEERD